MHTRGALDLQTTPISLESSGMRAYATSKLANVLFTKELQRRLSDTTAAANCLHPGVVRSRFGAFGSDFGVVVNTVYALAKPFAKTPEQGADSLMDPKLAADLWALSEALRCGCSSRRVTHTTTADSVRAV